MVATIWAIAEALWFASCAVALAAVLVVAQHTVRERRRVAGTFKNVAPRYRHGARGSGEAGGNAEWITKALLSACGKEKSGASPAGPGLPAEWELEFPKRLKAYEVDNSKTKVTLSTAQMLSVRWDLPQVVSTEMGLFADLIVKDFINYWYFESISKEPQFPDDVRLCLQGVLGRMGDRLLSINLPMFVMCDVSFILRHHLRWFSELKKRARKRCRPESEFHNISQDDRNQLVLDEFKRAGHLHPACSLTGQNEDPRTLNYIRNVTSELLVRLLSEEDYHCASLRHLLREVLTCCVLAPALECVTPDVINTTIISLMTEVDQNFQEQDIKSGDNENESNVNAADASTTSEENSFGKDSVDLRSTVTGVSAEEGEGVVEKKGSSIDFIQEASAELRQEESKRLVLELQAVLAECIDHFTSDPDRPMTSDSSAARQLIRILDLILLHGLKVPNDAQPRNELAQEAHEFCEPWWDFVRKAAELASSSEQTVNAIDSVVEAIFLDVDTESFISLENRNRSNDYGMEGKLSESSSIRFLKKSKDDKVIAQPGKAWLARMLNHRLLAEALLALVQDKKWVDFHYVENAAIRVENLIPVVASLNGIDFNYNIDKFWDIASRVRAKLDKKGIKSTKHEKLRRLRKRVGERISRKLRKLNSLQRRDQAIIALQDRLGAVKANIPTFTVRKPVGYTQFVQYVISLELTRRIDNRPSRWIIFRRYSEFYDLHRALKAKFGYSFDDVELPKKGGLFGSQSVSFINQRKIELEAYMNKVLEHPIVCDSEDVLTFVSPQTTEELDGSSSTSAGIEATEDLVASPKSDNINVTSPAAKTSGSRTGSSSPRSLKSGKSDTSAPQSSRPTNMQINPEELQMAEAHMYKLAQEVFEFHELSMFRRNMISITRSIASVMFQGTAQKWLQDNYTRDASANLLAKLLSMVRELLWPGGEFMQTDSEANGQDPVEAAETERHRLEALQILLDHVPAAMMRFLGKEKSFNCVQKLHEFLQHPALIHNLVFTTLDLLFLRIFPDLPLKLLHEKAAQFKE